MAQFIAGFLAGAFVILVFRPQTSKYFIKWMDACIEKKRCNHEWTLLHKTGYTYGPDVYVHTCKHCGKIKKTKS